MTQKIQKVVATQNQRQVSFTGDLLKLLRLRNNYTQEKLSQGICSISYMSKMENNQMPTNTYVLREVAKVFDTDVENFTYLNDGETIVSKLAKGFYYEDHPLLNDIAVHLKPFGENPITLLQQIICKLLSRDYGEIESAIEEIQPLIKSTPTDYTKLYGVVTAVYFYHTTRYHEALNILLNIENIQTEIGEIITLEQIYLYLVSERVGHHSASVNYYTKAKQCLSQHPHKKYAIKLPLFNAYFTTIKGPELGRNMIKKMSLNQLEKHHQNIFILTYLRSHIHEKDKHYNARYFAKLNHETKDEAYYQCLLIYEKYCAKYGLKLPFPMPDSGAIEERHLGAIHYIVDKMAESASKHRYLKKVALPKAIEEQDLFYIDYFTKEINRYALDNHRYKEVFMANQKQKKAIENIQAVI